MAGKGWIKLPREFFDFPEWQEKPFDEMRALIDLQLRASHKPTLINGVKMPAGSLLYSLRELANRFGWSVNRVRRVLKKWQEKQLVKLGEYSNEYSNEYSKNQYNRHSLKLVFYKSFQEVIESENSERIQQKTGERIQQQTQQRVHPPEKTGSETIIYNNIYTRRKKREGAQKNFSNFSFFNVEGKRFATLEVFVSLQAWSDYRERDLLTSKLSESQTESLIRTASRCGVSPEDFPFYVDQAIAGSFKSVRFDYDPRKKKISNPFDSREDMAASDALKLFLDGLGSEKKEKQGKVLHFKQNDSEGAK